MASILVTGAAGFIGYHLSLALLQQGWHVVGLDNLNPYYDVQLKLARVKLLQAFPAFHFHQLDLADRQGMKDFFAAQTFTRVAHMGAQAGVRYSLIDPHAYVDSNLVGFVNLLEGCRHHPVEHLVFASSSSVYGASTCLPFSVQHAVDHPISLYAATKKANELLAHSYSHLYQMPVTGLRFFTVYGPWGRPDMALFTFTKAILQDEPIDVFNQGKMKRDFTYIDDIIEGVCRVLDRIPQPDSRWCSSSPDPSSSSAPYRLYNIGNNCPVELGEFIETLESCLQKKAQKNLLPMQAGDLMATWADIDSLVEDIQFQPATPLELGIEKFVHWYKQYYAYR
ncbi:MAG: NAD-dependent epimerase [Synechococcaceae cyanobacterium SM2_3_1]|nr:NAD-dependent epimerase [Synechococcaceae cyanobacterium SM2_3_1]